MFKTFSCIFRIGGADTGFLLLDNIYSDLTVFPLSLAFQAGLKIIQSYMEGYRQDWAPSSEKDTVARGGWYTHFITKNKTSRDYVSTRKSFRQSRLSLHASMRNYYVISCTCMKDMIFFPMQNYPMLKRT